YERFAQTTSWRCLPGTAEMLAELREHSLRIAIASNFDRRLHAVVRGLSELTTVDDVFVSSEIGWRKPARGFFDAVAARLGVAPGEILFVGDDPENDIRGARA